MFKYFLPIGWMILIFILSSIPGSEYPATTFDYAPIAHFFEFAVLTWLVLRCFKLTPKTIILTLVFCALFALSDEIHQIFVFGRSASLMDWLIDFLAILCVLQFKIEFKKTP